MACGLPPRGGLWEWWAQDSSPQATLKASWLEEAPGVGGLPATDQSSGGPTDKGQVGSGFAAAAPWALPSLSMTGPFQGEVSIRFWSL